EYIRADRHVGPDFVLPGQVSDFEPELLVDGCLHGGRGVVDDVTEVAEAGDEGADVVFGQLGAILLRAWLVSRASAAARSVLTWRVHSATAWGSAPASRAAW